MRPCVCPLAGVAMPTEVEFRHAVLLRKDGLSLFLFVFLNPSVSLTSAPHLDFLLP